MHVVTVDNNFAHHGNYDFVNRHVPMYKHAMHVQVQCCLTKAVHTSVATLCNVIWLELDSWWDTALNLMPSLAPSQVLLLLSHF